LPGDEVFDFHRIAHRKNVGVTRAHLFIHADAAALAELAAI
jgi:hypothetical protein